MWIMCVCTGDWATRLLGWELELSVSWRRRSAVWTCKAEEAGRAQAEADRGGPGMKLEDRMDTLIWQLSARSDGICEGARDSGAMDTASL